MSFATQTTTPAAQQSFDDALHALMNARRPTKSWQKSNKRSNETRQDEIRICGLLDLLVRHCQKEQELHEKQHWKTLVLSLIYKRYHLLSPQAKLEAETVQQEADEKKKNVGVEVAAGEGERRLFYIAVRRLFHMHCFNSPEAMEALQVLLEIAPLAGGTRDVCALLEEFVECLLERQEGLRRTCRSLHGKESTTILVASGVHMITSAVQQTGTTSSIVAKAKVLQTLVELAARQLDHDCGLVAEDRMKKLAAKGTKSNDEHPELPSTLHMYLPHCNRGRTTGTKKRKRRSAAPPPGRREIANAVAEVLVWKQTQVAQAHPAFAGAYQALLRTVQNDIYNKEPLKKYLHTLQTIARKQRQLLNQFARESGFMLTDQFVLSQRALANPLKLSQIMKGKAGDLAVLTKHASKKHDFKIMNMIQFRTSKKAAHKFTSLTEIFSAWKAAPLDEENEIAQMERNIALARLKATVKYLSKLYNSKRVPDDNEADCKTEYLRKCLFASMDKSKCNHVAAILLASAAGNLAVENDDGLGDEMQVDASGSSASARLYLIDRLRPLDSLESTAALLDEVIHGRAADAAVAPGHKAVPTFMNGKFATTKAVVNLIERHLEDQEKLLLLSSADFQIPQDVMTTLQGRGCVVHCHDADNGLAMRLEREGARKGDITISLCWDTIDDLDLHVYVPSGEHINYANKRSRDGLVTLDVDMNAGSPWSEEPVENVFCGDLQLHKQAPLGHYKVVVQNFCYHAPVTGKRPIPYRIVVEKNGVKENYQGECKGSGSSSDTVACEFDYTGRKVAWPGEEDQQQQAVSAFVTSGLVSLTASTGQTLESLCQVIKTMEKLDHLEEVRHLVKDEEEEMAQEQAAPTPATDPRTDPRTWSQVAVAPRPVVAKHLEVTSRDLHQIRLTQLPASFHEIVGRVYGGPSLAEHCAREISVRMIRDKIPVSELKQNGYPDQIVQLVKKAMATAAT